MSRKQLPITTDINQEGIGSLRAHVKCNPASKCIRTPHVEQFYLFKWFLESISDYQNKKIHMAKKTDEVSYANTDQISRLAWTRNQASARCANHFGVSHSSIGVTCITLRVSLATFVSLSNMADRKPHLKRCMVLITEILSFFVFQYWNW